MSCGGLSQPSSSGTYPYQVYEVLRAVEKCSRLEGNLPVERGVHQLFHLSAAERVVRRADRQRARAEVVFWVPLTQQVQHHRRVVQDLHVDSARETRGVVHDGHRASLPQKAAQDDGQFVALVVDQAHRRVRRGQLHEATGVHIPHVLEGRVSRFEQLCTDLRGRATHFEHVQRLAAGALLESQVAPRERVEVSHHQTLVYNVVVDLVYAVRRDQSLQCDEPRGSFFRAAVYPECVGRYGVLMKLSAEDSVHLFRVAFQRGFIHKSETCGAAEQDHGGSAVLRCNVVVDVFSQGAEVGQEARMLLRLLFVHALACLEAVEVAMEEVNHCVGNLLVTQGQQNLGVQGGVVLLRHDEVLRQMGWLSRRSRMTAVSYLAVMIQDDVENHRP
ncbi:DUF480 domain-containing protein [Babesia caballi]|uniref:DUF480 domain-containing protein n=1 Tax=Babesia caballi TaxID=5871 RepID=A0AAV4LQQ0_BABCB|nr:DUF480 domain-containing protein [Babesia caballi]